MYRLISEGYELVLPHNYIPDLNLNFAEFAKVQGSRVFPTVLPNCPENDSFFEYAFDVQSNTNRKKKWEATLMRYSLFLGKGLLVLKSASKKNGYVCELQMPPALIEQTVWDTSIRKINIGSLQLTEKTFTDNSFHFMINEAIMNKFDVKSPAVYVEIKINNNVVVINHDPGRYMFFETYDEMWQDMAARYNTEANISMGFQMDVLGNNILFHCPSNAYTITITFRWLIYGFLDTYNFNQVSYKSSFDDYNGFANNTPNNSMFCLPTIHAPKFYTEETFNGYVNYYRGGFKRNTSKNPLQYNICPCLWVIKSVKKIFEALGYTTTGDFFQDQSNNQLYFITLVAADEQADEYNFRFNTLKSIINYADYLPNLTLKDFVVAICEFFSIDIEFNLTTKIATFSKLKNLLDNPNTTNISEKVDANIIYIEHQEHEKIQISYADLTDDEKKNSNYNSFPIEREENVKYSEILYKFKPPVLANDGNNQIVEISSEGESIFNKDFTQKYIWISFYKGLNTPIASSSLNSTNELDAISLYITGPNGLAARNTTLIKHLENTYTLKGDILVSDAEIAAIKSWQKFYINGVNFYLSNIQGKPNTKMAMSFKKA